MADFHGAIPEPRRPVRDPWYLPDIRRVEAVTRRYRRPRVTYEGLERIEHKQAVELLVETTGPFPVRALAPVLYIGDEPVPDWEREDDNRYRFFAFRPERLEEGAPLGLGWPGDPEPRRRAKQRFKLSKPGRRPRGRGG
jgi:hypothetical protein